MEIPSPFSSRTAMLWFGGYALLWLGCLAFVGFFFRLEQKAQARQASAAAEAQRSAADALRSELLARRGEPPAPPAPPPPVDAPPLGE